MLDVLVEEMDEDVVGTPANWTRVGVSAWAVTAGRTS